MADTISHNALILVADGGKAIFLRNHGNGGEVSLKEERRVTPRELVNDGPSGSRPTEQSVHQTDEATFAKHLAHALAGMHDANAYKDLVLIADSKTLGEMREAMTKSVASSIVKTMSKDLTNHSTAEITKALS